VLIIGKTLPRTSEHSEHVLASAYYILSPHNIAFASWVFPYENAITRAYRFGSSVKGS
jgi:hypothetical protein